MFDLTCNMRIKMGFGDINSQGISGTLWVIGPTCPYLFDENTVTEESFGAQM